MRSSLVNLLLIFLLISCGGGSKTGSSSNQPPINLPPVIEADVSHTVREKNEIKINAKASDTDGNISNYHWVLHGEQSIQLKGETSSEVSFIAPAVKSKTQLSLTLTVTDNKGAKATKNITVHVEPVIMALTIEGQSLLKSSNIKVSQNNTVITEIVSDDKGNYSIQLELDDDYAGDIIALESIGSGSSRRIGLKSLLGGFASLIEQAGEDKVLTKSENQLVDLNYLNTAIYSAMFFANQEKNISDVNTFNQEYSRVNIREVFRIASFFSYMSDKVDSSSEDNTLTMANNYHYIASLIKHIGLPAEFEQAAGKVFAEIEGQSFLPEQVYAFSAGGFEHRFNLILSMLMDGTGEVALFDKREAFDWRWEGHELHLKFKSPLYYRNINTGEEPGGPGTEHILALIAKFVTDKQKKQQMYIKLNIHRDNLGAKENEDLVRYNALEYEVNPQAPKLNSELPTKAFFANPATTAKAPTIENTINTIVDHAHIFNLDGTGVMPYTNASFTWSKNEKALTLKMAEDETVKVKQLTTGELSSFFLIEATKGNKITKYITKGHFQQQDLKWESVGIPRYISRYAASVHVSQFIYSSWYELHEDGNLDFKSMNGSGDLKDAWVRTGKWNITEDGALRLAIVEHESRRGDDNLNCRDESLPQCFLYKEHLLYLSAMSGNSYGIQENRNSFFRSKFPTVEDMKNNFTKYYVDSFQKFEKPLVSQ